MLRPTPFVPRPPLLAVLTLLACACGGGDGGGDDRPIERQLLEPGPYHVGVSKLDVAYLPVGASEERHLEVLIWYPTEDTEGTPTRYRLLPIRRDIFLDATPAGRGPYRSVIYSHGNQGIDWVAYPIGELLATQGLMTIAMDHTFNTFDDNTVGAGFEMSALRPQDVSAVLDAVEDLPPDHPLAGRLGEELALVGHSYGGYTALVVGGTELDLDAALAACAAGTGGRGCGYLDAPEHVALYRDGFLDERVDVVVAQAPAITFAFGQSSVAGVASIPTPLMHMTADGDVTITDEAEGDPIWAARDDPRDRRVRVRTGGHFTFVPVCYETPGVFEGDGCGDGFLDTRVALPIFTALIHAFMRRHLDGDEAVAPLLDGALSLHPEITVEAHGS